MRTTRSLLLPLALVALAAPANAQRFGVQASWMETYNVGAGARLEVPIGLQGQGRVGESFLIATFDYFFPESSGTNNFDRTYYEGNLGLAVPINITGIHPYVGAGVNVARATLDVNQPEQEELSDTDVGLNVLGGLRFPLGSVSMFGEGRWEMSNGRAFVLSVGLLFGGGN
jgi:hypothetical protein